MAGGAAPPGAHHTWLLPRRPPVPVPRVRGGARVSRDQRVPRAAPRLPAAAPGQLAGVAGAGPGLGGAQRLCAGHSQEQPGIQGAYYINYYILMFYSRKPLLCFPLDNDQSEESYVLN